MVRGDTHPSESHGDTWPGKLARGPPAPAGRRGGPALGKRPPPPPGGGGPAPPPGFYFPWGGVEPNPQINGPPLTPISRASRPTCRDPPRAKNQFGI